MTGRADRLLIAAFGLSGAAALGYELLWTQLLSVALGHETLGVLGVLAGFFGGMALGSAVMHPRVRATADPIRMFARLELAAAGFALISPFALHGLAAVLPGLLGEVAGNNDTPLALAATITISAVALLPATFCMGATLPALVEARRRAFRDEPDGRGVGRLYGANALGAALGVLLTTYLLLPGVGLVFGAVVLAALGMTSAWVARRWAAQTATTNGRDTSEDGEPTHDGEPSGDREPEATIDASADPDAEVAREPWLLWVVLGSTGLLGVGLEVVGVQVLSQMLENTIYTFAHTLAVYLLGTATGAWSYARWVKPAISGRPATVLAGLLIAQAVTVVIASLALAWVPDLLASLTPEGASYGAHLRAEAAVALAVFGLPTIVMGATFAHAVGLIAPGGIGRAYAINTLGSAVAPLVFALWVVPDNGYRDALFVVVYGYLLVFGVFTWFRRFSAKVQLAAILGVVALTVVAPDDLRLARADPGWTTLEQRETVMGLVIVSEQPPPPGAPEGRPPLRKLQVGRHFRMGGAMAFGERRMGHLPLLLHPAPRRALFLGVGTGATLGAVTSHEGLLRVDAVELVPAVLDQLHFFSDINGDVAEASNVHLHAADGRRFVAASDEAYDVVVADLFHPGRNGAGGLYAAEHFEAVRAHLAPGGSFTQWIPLYQVDAPTLALIVRTFTDVFPHASAWLGVYNVQTPAIALIGANEAQTLELDAQRIAAAVRAPIYAEVLMQEPRDLLGAYITDHDGLVAFAGEGPRNTDLHPRVMLAAPRVAYEGNRGRGWQNLQALLQARTPPPIVGDSAPEWQDDARRFGEALDHYLHAESLRIGTDPPADMDQIPDAAVAAYLAAYSAAPQFAPSRGMLYVTASQAPRYATEIFEHMLERTPDEARVYQAYLRHLQRSGDKARFDEVRAMAQERVGPPPGP